MHCLDMSALALGHALGHYAYISGSALVHALQLLHVTFLVVMGDTIPKISIPSIRYFQKQASIPVSPPIPSRDLQK